MKNQSVAIVGIGAILPGAQNYEEFWNNSLGNKCFVKEVNEESLKIEDLSDSDVFESDNNNPMESISEEQIYGVALARQSLIDAGLYGKKAKNFDKKRAGVIMSSSEGKGVSRVIANRFNLTGMTCTVDSTCESGLAAVKFAAQELMLGNCDLMIAGDKEGAVVLKKVSQAEADGDRIYAVIEEIGTSNDKNKTDNERLNVGIIGLVRAALSIYHKQILPSGSGDKKPQPWIVNRKKPVRYYSVSDFGFDGTNYDVLLKEHKTEHKGEYSYSRVPRGILIAGENKENLIDNLQELVRKFKENPENLFDRKYTYRNIKDDWNRLGFAVNTVEEAIDKAEYSIKMLSSMDKDFLNIKGIIYADKSWKSKGKITALFSGQGSQKCDMFSEVTCEYPEMRNTLTLVDNELINSKLNPVSEFIYPRANTEEEKEKAGEMLKRTEYTQPALAAVEAGLFNIMKARGFSADLMIGHSFGELVALYAAGAYDEKTLIKLSAARGKYMSESAKLYKKTGMAAVKKDYEYVKNLIKDFENVCIANANSPEQIIIAGEEDVLDKVKEKAELEDIKVKKLQVSAAFHSPFMKEAKERFNKILRKTDIKKPRIKVIANCTANEYNTAKDVYDILPEQLVSTVLFQESIEKAYEDGSRIFVEIGPGRVLTGLVGNCLSDKKDYVSIASGAGDDSLMQLESTLISLAVLGLPIIKDKYHKKVNEEIKIKKSKTTYTVPPKNVVIQQEEVKESGSENMIEEEEIKEMNNNDIEYEIKKLNAQVVGEYVKCQNEQFNKVAELIGNSTIKSNEDKQLLCDCVKSFQENALSALKIFFAGQGQDFEAGNKQLSAPVEVLTKEEDEPEELKLEELEIDDDEDDVLEEVSADVVEEVKEVKEVKPVEVKTSSKPKNDVDIEEVKKLVIGVISEVTGYPDDMLETDMTLESDLGIDSIKRFELFTSIDNELGNVMQKDDIATLAVVQTIDDCIDAIKTIKENLDI